MTFAEWWKGKTPFMKCLIKFVYGLLVVLIIVGITNSILSLPIKEDNGLRINDNYIKSVSGQEAYVNDVYVTTMVNFVDYCNSTSTLHRFSDFKGRLYGITLWCKNSSKAFTFFYSDKWRIEQYGKFEEVK